MSAAEKVGANPGQRISELTMICHGEVPASVASINPSHMVLDRNSIETGVADLIEKTISLQYPNSQIISFDNSMLQKLDEAIRIIENADRTFAQIVRKHIEGFIFVSSVAFRSASFPHFQGIVLLGPNHIRG